MTDLRKAAEMALEALEMLDRRGGLGLDVHEYIRTKIEALRQALAQPEQEPVAWADKVGAVIPHSHKLFQPDLLKDYTRPLYTAPPKKEWVGLTRDEVLDIEETTKHPLAFYGAIEAKLKEKNT